jgi:hypothetical protein
VGGVWRVAETSPPTDQINTARPATIRARKMTAAATTKPTSSTEANKRKTFTGALLSVNVSIVGRGSAPHNVDNY